jgi:hypothetical protein
VPGTNGAMILSVTNASPQYQFYRVNAQKN